MKSIFSRQGVPALIISDRGPPFTSSDLKYFYKTWNINVQWSSPYYPKSNGLVEGTVKLVKNTLIKCKEGGEDPYLAMLHLRNACQFGQEAPSKLLNARYLRTNIPVVKDMLRTKPVPYKQYTQNAERRMRYSKNSYDKNTKPLPPFSMNETIWFQKKPGSVWLPAIITKVPQELNSFRAYEITTPQGKTFVRNRVYLRQRILRNNNNNKKQLDSNSKNQDFICNNNSNVTSNSLDCSFDESLYSGLFSGTESGDIGTTRSEDVDNNVDNVNTEPEVTLEAPESEDYMSDSLLVNLSTSPEVVLIDSADDSFDSTVFSTVDDSALDPSWKP
uniref:Uncharacterized protein K02A2.6 n=1 Tax=Cacopsylla melanoneura TaxID=428564 RepID=A0A8D8QBK6_9HEMI